MFKLKFNAGNKKISYKPDSVSVKYFIDNKKLEADLKQFEKVSGIKLSSLQKKTFLSDKGNEIRISKPGGKPDEFSGITLQGLFRKYQQRKLKTSTFQYLNIRNSKACLTVKNIFTSLLLKDLTLAIIHLISIKNQKKNLLN